MCVVYTCEEKVAAYWLNSPVLNDIYVRSDGGNRYFDDVNYCYDWLRPLYVRMHYALTTLLAAFYVHFFYIRFTFSFQSRDHQR